MDNITIPPEALEAAYDARRKGGTLEDICIAMIKAWPGMHRGHQCTGCGGDPQVILPLIQEQTDDH